MKMALPRKGLRGVEKIADTTAWTNSMAESDEASGQGHLTTCYKKNYSLKKQKNKTLNML